MGGGAYGAPLQLQQQRPRILGHQMPDGIGQAASPGGQSTGIEANGPACASRRTINVDCVGARCKLVLILVATAAARKAAYRGLLAGGYIEVDLAMRDSAGILQFHGGSLIGKVDTLHVICG